MNYSLKEHSSDTLVKAYEEAVYRLQSIAMDKDEKDEVRERIQDILEILNHRGVRMKL